MSSETTPKQRLPLDGIRVLELSHIVAGPSGGMILADLGADVIKIEHPQSGDTSRGSGNNGATFFTYNRNKKYLALDLRQAKGKAIFERLVKNADVVFNNFAPGALDRLGLGYEWGRRINPRIIYCAVKGFLPGPFGDRPYLDELAQMAGGLAYLTGLKDLPLRAGASVTDIGAATYGALAVVAALFRRHSTGVGESIEAGLRGDQEDLGGREAPQRVFGALGQVLVSHPSACRDADLGQLGGAEDEVLLGAFAAGAAV